MYDRKKSDMGSDGRAVDGGSGTAGGPFMEGTTYLTRPSPWNGWITFCLAISGLSWNKYGKKCPPAPQRGTFLQKMGRRMDKGKEK